MGHIRPLGVPGLIKLYKKECLLLYLNNDIKTARFAMGIGGGGGMFSLDNLMSF